MNPKAFLSLSRYRRSSQLLMMLRQCSPFKSNDPEIRSAPAHDAYHKFADGHTSEDISPLGSSRAAAD